MIDIGIVYFKEICNLFVLARKMIAMILYIRHVHIFVIKIINRTRTAYFCEI